MVDHGDKLGLRADYHQDGGAGSANGAYHMLPPTDPQYGDAMGVPVKGTAGQENEFLDPEGKYQVKFAGGFAAVECAVTSFSGLKSDGGKMVTLSHNVDIDVNMEGGVGSSLLRCCCAGESAFFAHYRLKPGMGERGDVLLAPGVPGEIIMLNLDGSPGRGWCISKGSFLGCDHSIAINVVMQGLAKGCCSGLGFFVMEATGQGRLLLSSYGALMRYEVQPGEVRTIDHGFVVAWSKGMQYEGTPLDLLRMGLIMFLMFRSVCCSKRR
mmetsp:Transcript_1902/g.5621  ORF Transcript_1902/g.5621 Transcript_1902/m.5621 type:complete len:268 (+) Transcript_1902:175-978(+)